VSETSPARSRRLSAAVIASALFGVTVAVAAAIIFWLNRTDATLSSIEVLPHSMHCGVHDVPYVLIADDLDPEPFIGFDLTLRPDSFCQLQLTFVNRGSRSVHVDTATFRAMGSGEDGHGPFEITQNGGRFTARDAGTDPDTGAAVLEVDEDLAGGESFTQLFDMRARVLSFVPDSDVVTTYDHIPSVQVSYWGRSADIDGSVNIRLQYKSDGSDE
jgi:hypothetical protein